MIRRRSEIVTTQADRYLKRLSTHFSHKINVDMTEDCGRFEFDRGVCQVNILDASMRFMCEAENEDDLNEVVQAMDNHFVNFASRERLSLEWK